MTRRRPLRYARRYTTVGTIGVQISYVSLPNLDAQSQIKSLSGVENQIWTANDHKIVLFKAGMNGQPHKHNQYRFPSKRVHQNQKCSPGVGQPMLVNEGGLAGRAPTIARGGRAQQSETDVTPSSR